MSLQKLIEERESFDISGVVYSNIMQYIMLKNLDQQYQDALSEAIAFAQVEIKQFHSQTIQLIIYGVVEMVRESGLGQLIEFYESNRGSGHTYAAVKGVENSANALLLVADGHQKQSTGLPMDKQISLTGRYVLKGRRHALVVDNFALIQMFYRLISQLQTLKK